METDFSKIYSLMKEDNLSVETKEFIFNLAEQLKYFERCINNISDEFWDRYSKLENDLNTACGSINEALNKRIDEVVESIDEIENATYEVKDDLEALRIDFDALDDDFRELVRTDE